MRRARAFAPGHVTGVFRPELDARDPRGRGTVGAGLVLEAGVLAEASWAPRARSSVSVVAQGRSAGPITEDVAWRLRPSEPGQLRVELQHALPVGQGFGMSAAGALATAMAVAGLSGAAPDRAIETAHLADLFGGGGLGGVSAILGGGLERRVRPGIPPFGVIARQAFEPTVMVGVVGPPIPSPSILADARRLRRIRSASTDLDELLERASADEFLEASERFTDEVGLLTPAVRSTIRGLRRLGARAAQAMFGNAFFAVAPARPVRDLVAEELERRGVRWAELRVSHRGAHPLGSREAPSSPAAGWQAF